MTKLYYIHSDRDLLEILLALGNPEGLSRLVAKVFMQTHKPGEAFTWEQLKEETSKAAGDLVSEAAQQGIKENRFELVVDEEGDLSFQEVKE